MRLLQRRRKYLNSSPRLFNHTFCSEKRGSLPSFVAILRAIEIDISRQSELFLRYKTSAASAANDRASTALSQPQECKCKPTVRPPIDVLDIVVFPERPPNSKGFKSSDSKTVLSVWLVTYWDQLISIVGSRADHKLALVWSFPIPCLPCPGLEYQCGHAKQIT